MIPRTYPTSLSGTTNCIRIFKITPGASDSKWSTYIPIKAATAGTGSLNTYNEDGAIAAESLAGVTGLTAWIDYIPVAVVTDPDTGRWRVDATGFIPMQALVGTI